MYRKGLLISLVWAILSVVWTACAQATDPMLTWESRSQVSGNGLSATLATATFHGRLYLFSQGVKDSLTYVNSTADGSAWTGWSQLPGNGPTDATLTAATFNVQLYLFGKGVADKQVYVNSTADGTTWNGWSNLPGGGLPDAAALSAVTFNSQLYLLGTGGSLSVYVNSTGDGHTWSGWRQVPGNASVPPPKDCPTLPAGGFLKVWLAEPELQTALGCPNSYHPRITPNAWEVKTSYQPFEHGAMIWSDHIGWYWRPSVYVLFADSTYQRFDDTFDAATDPISGNEKPPEGLSEPLLGFGKVWCNEPAVREALGWATAPETAGQGRFQMFSGGDMVWIDQTNQTYVFRKGSNMLRVFGIPF